MYVDGLGGVVCGCGAVLLLLTQATVSFLAISTDPTTSATPQYDSGLFIIDPKGVLRQVGSDKR